MSNAQKLNVNATRMELISLRNRKKLAQNGYELLNKKLETLTAELFSILQQFKELNKQVRPALKEATEALTLAEMAMGPLKVREIAESIPETISVEAVTRSLMGVRVPKIQLVEKEHDNILYSLSNTSAYLDMAQQKFINALKLVVQLAEYQSTISRLSVEIQSTKRRVNALKNIVIPRFEATIEYIKLTLAEREREEFVRLKKVKANLEKMETEMEQQKQLIA